jgi:hypothetical protein
MAKTTEHRPIGDPCVICGKRVIAHRAARGKRQWKKKKYKPVEEFRCFGIDGEGQGRLDHRYVMLSAADSRGFKSYIKNDTGLTTVECLDFLLSLPNERDCRFFAFGFGYDWTKIIEDIPNPIIYRLMRPQLRKDTTSEGFKSPRGVHWNGYILNYVGSQYSIKRKGDRKSIVIWDAFKFFQAKFVSALKAWKIGTDEELEVMTKMKDMRAFFDTLTEREILQYNLKECKFLAQLMEKLIKAHEAVGLKLKVFHGAGSTSKALLKKMGIKEKITPTPEEMTHAVASAFFGGRFENSRIGVVQDIVYSRDISSAYPYQMCLAPDLSIGTWEWTTRREALNAWNVRTAVVNYGLGSNPGYTHWGPFPFRTSDGSIVFPIESGGGWVWLSEFLAGERAFTHVQFKGAWVYKSDEYQRPFKDISKYYIERCRIGKEGPGIVLKLGMNGGYGALAQSVGSPQFNDWKWAGMITAGCRAQDLDIMNMHHDRSNLLMIATDGVYSLEQMELPMPLDTGTFGVEIDEKDEQGNPIKVKKPLGGWEEKVIKQGVFLARPGVYFPLNPTDKQLNSVRGRGVGRNAILKHWNDLVTSFNRDGINQTVRLPDISRFCGAKTCITASGQAPDLVYRRAMNLDGYKPTYGQWIAMKVELGFNPMPKRGGVDSDNKTLLLRSFSSDKTSQPYQRGMKSPDGERLAMSDQHHMEQPDPYEFSMYY